MIQIQALMQLVNKEKYKIKQNARNQQIKSNFKFILVNEL